MSIEICSPTYNQQKQVEEIKKIIFSMRKNYNDDSVFGSAIASVLLMIYLENGLSLDDVKLFLDEKYKLFEEIIDEV